MHSIILLTLLTLAYFITQVQMLGPHMNKELFHEAILDTTEFINLYGYPAENHTVYTTDGYILTMHRIPAGRRNNNKVMNERKPVILIHGVSVASSLFVDSGYPSLGFYLADEGYDVWLGNMRGTVYSRNKKYSRKDKQFWNFSWDEMAEYDATAMIDYVLNTTGFKKLPYIAHSMGTTVGLALFSTRSDYRQKVSGFIALSPVGSMRYATTLFRIAADFESILVLTLNLLKMYSVGSIDPKYFGLVDKVCALRYNNLTLCTLELNAFCGYSEGVRNNSRDFLYFIHQAESGASVRTLQHFAQMMRKEGLYKYDFGKVENLKKYRKAVPPKYLLNEIDIPVVMFYSANDVLGDPLDVISFSRSLPNILGIELVGPPAMNHIDMTYGLDARNIFQDKLLIYLRKL